MLIAPLPALSCRQFIMSRETGVVVSRVSGEALLRAAEPGVSADHRGRPR
jgi:hypothetical protein